MRRVTNRQIDTLAFQLRKLYRGLIDRLGAAPVDPDGTPLIDSVTRRARNGVLVQHGLDPSYVVQLEAGRVAVEDAVAALEALVARGVAAFGLRSRSGEGDGLQARLRWALLELDGVRETHEELAERVRDEQLAESAPGRELLAAMGAHDNAEEIAVSLSYTRDVKEHLLALIEAAAAAEDGPFDPAVVAALRGGRKPKQSPPEAGDPTPDGTPG